MPVPVFPPPVKAGGTEDLGSTLPGMDSHGGRTSERLNRRETWDADTQSACIEMGCTADQRTITGELSNIAERADAGGLKAPVVIVVGDVVGCAGDLVPDCVRAQMHAE